MSTGKILREQIAALVRQYYQAQFSDRTFNPTTDLIHYAGRVFDAEELCNLVDASLDFFLTANRYAERFEAGFRRLPRRVGRAARELRVVRQPRRAHRADVAEAAATAGCSRATRSSRLPPGSRRRVAPILQNGLVPVFVDVNLGDYTADPDQLRDAIGPRTRAIMMAHTLGVPFDLDAVMRARQAARPLGDRGQLRRARIALSRPADGDVRPPGDFSFYPAHHITMGEGGAVATNDDELARIARSFRDWGRDCYCAGGENNTCGTRFSQQFGTLPYGYDHKYVYSHIGYNLKVTDMQAAIGCAQLDKLDGFVAARRRELRSPAGRRCGPTRTG